MRLGVFGGTFDPLHLGHMAVAEGALRHLRLDEVIFIPAGRPWMKEGMYLLDGHHRLRMVELAVDGIEGFRVDHTELRREGLTYTVDTLREMAESSYGEDEVYLLLGSDAYDSFELWKDPGEILRMSTLAVASRPGGHETTFEKLDSLCPDGSHRGVALPIEQVDISSSDIRSRVHQRLSIVYHVPVAVERYIHEHRIYAELGGRSD